MIQFQMANFRYILQTGTAIMFLFLSVFSFAQSKKEQTENISPTQRVGVFKVLPFGESRWLSGLGGANKILLPAFAYNGETLPLITLKDVPVVTSRIFKSEKEKQAYLKLKRDVKKAYPYAILASVKLREYDAILSDMPKKKRTPYLKKVEKELSEQFENDLKNLTVNQGKILIRLIDRETGMSTYKVIKEYRNVFVAFFWQSFAILWGNNLKWRYDPSRGEDKLIEEIIGQIEDGEV